MGGEGAVSTVIKASSSTLPTEPAPGRGESDESVRRGNRRTHSLGMPMSNPGVVGKGRGMEKTPVPPAHKDQKRGPSPRKQRLLKNRSVNIRLSKFEPLPGIRQQKAEGSDTNAHKEVAATYFADNTDNNVSGIAEISDLVSIVHISSESAHVEEQVPEIPVGQSETAPTSEEDNQQEEWELAIKLLDGSRIVESFQSSDSLGEIISRVEMSTGNCIPRPCIVYSNEVPIRKFVNLQQSLREAGLSNKAVIGLMQP
eukprot:Nk52_evm55s745 gene=Nk52_evmTU55s745